MKTKTDLHALREIQNHFNLEEQTFSSEGELVLLKFAMRLSTMSELELLNLKNTNYLYSNLEKAGVQQLQGDNIISDEILTKRINGIFFLKRKIDYLIDFAIAEYASNKKGK